MGQSLHRVGDLGLLARDLAWTGLSKTGPGRDERKQRIVERLGLMHGLPQKIGQLLAFSDEDRSPGSFRPLTENDTTLPSEEAFAAMERLTGRSIQDGFRSIDPNGISASIGQVHRATLQDGREVAVKVQYPGIAAHLRWDLEALQWLTAPVGGLGNGFNLQAYREEIGERLREELDFLREAEALGKFARWTAGWDGFVLPQVIPEWSGPNLLTTTWIPGGPVAITRSWSESERKSVATTLTRFFLEGLFDWGCIHADLHPGNLRFFRDATPESKPYLGVIDFGCVRSIPARLSDGLRGLISDLSDKPTSQVDPEQIFQRFVSMGFQGPQLRPFAEKLPSLGSILCEPFLSGGETDAARWNPGERLAELLGPHRMAFRLAGPPELLFILRGLRGLLYHLRVLGQPVDWARWISHRGADAPLQTSQLVDAKETRVGRSESLHIEVRDGFEIKVALTFAAEATDQLPSLVPAECQARLASRNISPLQLAEEARRRNYAPGELFSLQDGTKNVRIWLA